MSAFDSSTMIATFSADASKTSLQMPHMTTGQRKNVKKLLEEYPELRCESYGFGAERCLHLFKKNHADVSTKTQSSASPLDISSCGIKTTLTEHVVPSAAEQVAGSVGDKMSVSGCESASVTHVRTELILPLTMENLQVRNTFIHMRAVSADERAVQSMPHGMFKQCLLSEVAEAREEQTFFCDTPTSAGGDSPSFSSLSVDTDPCGHCPPISIGSLVLVAGLVKLPAYNGRSAIVDAWDEATGRYCILIACANGSCLEAKVKAENLRMVTGPCPC